MRVLGLLAFSASPILTLGQFATSPIIQSLLRLSSLYGKMLTVVPFQVLLPYGVVTLPTLSVTSQLRL